MKPNTILEIVAGSWVACEVALLFIKRSRKEDVTRHDSGSMNLLWMSIAAACFLAGSVTRFSATRMPPLMRWPAFWTGIALIVIGFAIRLAAIFTLRRYFTVDVAIAKDHQVIDRGLYGIVRHPSYAGSILSFIGLGLAFMNWLSLAIVVIGPSLAFVYRIRVEERALTDALGDAYRAYAARTKRLIPRVF